MRFLIILLSLFLLGCSPYNLASYKPTIQTQDCFDRACQIKTILNKKCYRTRFVIGINKDRWNGHAWIEYKVGNKWFKLSNFDSKSITKAESLPNKCGG